MPKQIKIQREDIINATFEIVKKHGLDSINARAIAKKLNCSIQPIFYQFANMEELKKVVYEKIYEVYKEYMLNGINSEKAYMQMGISYIKFAKDYPEFFKIVFMQKTTLNPEKFIMADAMGEKVIRTGQKCSGLTFEEQKDFHTKVWIFTHGIATLVATETIEFTEEEIEKLLGSTVRQMIKGYKIEKENK